MPHVNERSERIGGWSPRPWMSTTAWRGSSCGPGVQAQAVAGVQAARGRDLAGPSGRTASPLVDTHQRPQPPLRPQDRPDGAPPPP